MKPPCDLPVLHVSPLLVSGDQAARGSALHRLARNWPAPAGGLQWPVTKLQVCGGGCADRDSGPSNASTSHALFPNLGPLRVHERQRQHGQRQRYLGIAAAAHAGRRGRCDRLPTACCRCMSQPMHSRLLSLGSNPLAADTIPFLPRPATTATATEIQRIT